MRKNEDAEMAEIEKPGFSNTEMRYSNQEEDPIGDSKATTEEPEMPAGCRPPRSKHY
jgi:hypothetical protein